MRRAIVLAAVFPMLLGRAAFAQTDDSITVPDAVLHYSIYGTGQPILFLSGGPGDASSDLIDISHHLDTRYECILFDQRGTGLSHTSPMDSTTINLYQAIADIHVLLQRLAIPRVILLGHSWGAMLATSYAIAYPHSVAKLVLVDPGPLKWEGFEQIIDDDINAKASKADRAVMQEARDSAAHHTASPALLQASLLTFDRLLFYDSRKFDSIYTALKAQHAIPAHNARIETLMEQDLTRIHYDATAGMATLEMPILVITGRQDPVSVFPTFAIKEANPRARIAWIERAGHFSWLENPKAFYSRLLRFLR